MIAMSSELKFVLTLLILIAGMSMCLFHRRVTLFFQAIARWMVGPTASLKTWRFVGLSLIGVVGGLLITAGFLVNH